MAGEASTTFHHVVECDAIQNLVNSVTVFQTDRAEVNRRIMVELNAGQSDIEIRNLPTCLLEDSIRVDGVGDATIFDVIYQPPNRYDSSSGDGELAVLKAHQRKIESKLEILKQQTEVLRDYSKTLRAAEVDSAKLESFLDVYSSRKNKIDDATIAFNDELLALRKEETEKRRTVIAYEESLRKRGVRVTIVVSAERKGPVELSLTYLVSRASWTPQYDLRASVASDSKSQSAVSLHYRASISQQTGEDWNGIALTLSTASPLQGTKVPSLSPYWIGEKVQAPTAIQSRPLMRKKMTPRAVQLREMDSESESESEDDLGLALFDNADGAAQPFRSRDSEATVGAVSSVFSIPGLSNIPSASNAAQQTHKVSIAELQFDSVDLEWVTVPREIPSVFLQCRVKNTSNYVLLPGQANVFMNGGFVAKSSILHVSPQESFRCSLGVDPAIRITYHPRTTKSRTSGNGIISVKTNSTVYEQKISIKNTRLSNVPKLYVREQVPVSRDAKIRVAILEPKSLQKGKVTVLNEGVSCRWSNWKAIVDGDLSSRESEEADVESAQGMLEWICSIEPSSSVDLTLSWDISAPSGVEWVQK